MLNAFNVKQKLLKSFLDLRLTIFICRNFTAVLLLAVVSLITVNGKDFNIWYISSNIAKLFLFGPISLQIKIFFYCFDYIV